MNLTLRLKRGRDTGLVEAGVVKRQRRQQRLNIRLKLGIVILAIFVVGSFGLPFFSTVDPSLQGTYLKNMPFSAQHLLGTNSLGQDIFWFLVFAIRNSLMLGVAVSVGITFLSTLIGLSAGYIGGWYERIILLIIDAFITIPVFPILIVLSALLQGKTSFVSVGLILVAFGWAWGARTTRSMVLSLREREFVSMAHFSGSSTASIIVHEIFPYVSSYTVVQFINTVLFAINIQAALAVIGLSTVQVPTLGSILFWALNYNALFIGQITWLVAPIVATVLLFLGLFLVSTGYNELFATKRGIA